MNDRPADLQNFDPKRDVKIIPSKDGKTETYLFPSDPETDVNHDLNKLPKEMWQDYGNDNAGQVARAVRMYERALASQERSMVAPEWHEVLRASLIATVPSVVVAVAFNAGWKALNLPENSHWKEVLTDAILVSTAVVGIHAGQEIIAPKHVNTTSSETAELVRQARDQARKSYVEAVQQERIVTGEENEKPNNSVHPSNAKAEKFEMEQQPELAASVR
jgi:hypothetical protein